MLQKSALFSLIIFFISGTLYAAPAAPALQDTLPAGKTALADTAAAPEFLGIEASFKGGEEGWKDFMARNLQPDVPVVAGAPAGSYTVVVQFIVDKTGYVKEIMPLTRFGYGMEAEVVRVIKKSPRWEPALLDGKPVNAYRKQPITFTIEEVKKKRRLF